MYDFGNSKNQSVNSEHPDMNIAELLKVMAPSLSSIKVWNEKAFTEEWKFALIYSSQKDHDKTNVNNF